MLNAGERFIVLKFIRNCYIFGWLPAGVDICSWKLVQNKCVGRKRWLKLAYFGFYALHSLYKVLTLISACFVQACRPPLHQLIIHALLALVTPVIIFWFYLLFIKHPGAFRVFMHITLTGDIGGMITNVHRRQNGSIVSRRREYTLQDLIAMNLPYMVMPLFVTLIALYAYYPHLELLLYAGLPTGLQNWFTFVILLLEEMRFLVMPWVVAIPVYVLQIIAFELINTQLKFLITSMQRTNSRQKLQLTYVRLRHVQLYVIIMNVVNRYIIFTGKLLCIGASIGTGYAAIAHFSKYPIFGIMYYIIVIDGTFIYTVCYDKAFQIPRLCEDTAKLALLRLGQIGHVDMRAFKRQMQSIPRIAIKVGEFHVLERQSTPAFVHYVLSNIVTLLVAFRQ